MAKITFSVELGKLTKQDIDESSIFAEDFFQMEEKPDEMQASEENKNFILNNIPECDNVIRADGKVIGFTYIVPCNKDIMERFLSKEITENDLMEEVKDKINYDNFETIYLCATFLKEEYRGKGLATKGMIMSIEKIIEKRKIKPLLFYWSQTPEGKKTVERVSEKLGFDLKVRSK